jgi:hypothetical protein
MNTSPERPLSVSQLRKAIGRAEADLLDQGVKLYPRTRTGERARSLWLQIKRRLLRGAAVEITASALGLAWHRQGLKRAREVLVEMGLIKPRADGCYVLGPLGPFSMIDKLIREQFFDLKLLEEVVVALSEITSKSKTRGK